MFKAALRMHRNQIFSTTVSVALSQLQESISNCKPSALLHCGGEISRKRQSTEPDKPKVPFKHPKVQPREETPSEKYQEPIKKSEEAAFKVEEGSILNKTEGSSKKEVKSGMYALNSLLTRSLNAELQDLMAKVWRIFPVESECSAEALVADRFRNKAGDELCNMFGLNVTQRLLNVFNPMYVKLVFSSTPPKDLFKAFVKKYNIKAIRELDPYGRMYVAEAKDIATFDELCNGNEKQSGNIKVTVQPCYRFNYCPPNLECSFSKPVISNIKKTNNDTNNSPKTTNVKGQKDQGVQRAKLPQKPVEKTNINKSNKTVTNSEKPKETVQTLLKSKHQNSSPLVKIKEEPKINKKPTETKPVQETPTKPNINTIKVKTETPPDKFGQNIAKNGENLVKPVTTTAIETTVNEGTKSTPTKTAQNVVKVVKTVPKATTVGSKTPPAKVTLKEDKTENVVKHEASIANKKLPMKVEQPKAQDKPAQKINPVNTVSKMKTNVKDTPDSKTNTIAKGVTGVKPKVNQNQKVAPKANQASKSAIKTPTKTNVKAKPTPNKDFDMHDDDEELNDEEILKLLCGDAGIVLDQCSGSDEE